MLAEERFAMILDLLAQKRSATVLELCDALDASESTIRQNGAPNQRGTAVYLF